MTGGEGRFQNPFLFPCRKKKRFLESKEKGAFEIWCAVGCPAAACVFTPPWGTGPGRYGLCGRNREGRIFYLSAAWAVGVAAWFGAQIRGPARAQRSGSRGERTSKGAERVFAVRRKQSEADFARTMSRPTNSVVPYRCGGRPQAAPTKTEKRSGRGGLWPPARSGVTFPSVILSVPFLSF